MKVAMEVMKVAMEATRIPATGENLAMETNQVMEAKMVM